MEITLYYNNYGEVGQDTDAAYGEGEYFVAMYEEDVIISGFETFEHAKMELDFQSEKFSIEQ